MIKTFFILDSILQLGLNSGQEIWMGMLDIDSIYHLFSLSLHLPPYFGLLSVPLEEKQFDLSSGQSQLYGPIEIPFHSKFMGIFGLLELV